ncbi:MAG TPA: nitrile hydratase accessory protein, partial [Rhodopila sp.]|nr:nitrile hydratase accessory protein [Rhodopila sp.]
MSDPIPVDLGTAPPFREPWQAKAFALVILLHREGRFRWEEWVQTLAAEIAAAPQRPGEDAELTYHRQFLAALETITAARGMATAEAMHARKLAWRRAYLNTPHGHAVDLAAAGDGDETDDPDADGADDHHHGDDLRPQRAPIAV